MSRLDGLVAVVTGGGRGIGRAIALEMAREGAKLAISSRTQKELDSVVSEISDLGSEGLSVVADAMSRSESKEPVRRAFSYFGSVDILVNNVGGSVPGNQDPFLHDDIVFDVLMHLGRLSCLLLG